MEVLDSGSNEVGSLSVETEFDSEIQRIENRLMIPDFLYESLNQPGVDLVNAVFAEVRSEVERVENLVSRRNKSLRQAFRRSFLESFAKDGMDFRNEFLAFYPRGKADLLLVFESVKLKLVNLRADLLGLGIPLEEEILPRAVFYVFRKFESKKVSKKIYLGLGGTPDFNRPITLISDSFTESVYQVLPGWGIV